MNLNQKNTKFNLAKKYGAFSLFELILVLGILGIIAAIALPKFANYPQAVCMKKLQAQMLGFKLALKSETRAAQIGAIADFNKAFLQLDLAPSSCYFSRTNSKNTITIIAHNADKIATFSLDSNGILKCDEAKSSQTKDKISYCKEF